MKANGASVLARISSVCVGAVCVMVTGAATAITSVLMAAPAQAAPDLGPRESEFRVGCSAAALIAAINKANSAAGGHLTLTRNCTYTLTSAQAGTEDGLPPIRSRIAIDGKGATITRSSDPKTPAFRIFEVLCGGQLTLGAVTVSHGDTLGPDPDGGGGIAVRAGARLVARSTTVRDNVGALGGGINNFGTAEVTGSIVVGNDGLHGGGVSNSSPSGTLRLTNTVLTGNRAESDAGVGGAVYNQLGGTATLVNTVIKENVGDNSAGGVRNDHGSVMYLTNSSVSQNRAGPLFNAPTTVTGGGIQNLGTMVLRRTTVDHNHAARTGPPTIARGGGIANLLSDEPGAAAPTLSLIDSQVTDNIADNGPGGIYNDRGTVTLRNTAISGNMPTNCAGSSPPVPGCSG
jgi:hypothetical protein